MHAELQLGSRLDNTWQGTRRVTPAISARQQGVVSLTLHELAKIISRKYTTPEITFMVRNSSWNFVCVPKAWLWSHLQSFSLKLSSQVLFLRYIHFERIFWRARETTPRPHFEGILPTGPYLPCVSMAGRALLAGYHWFIYHFFSVVGANANMNLLKVMWTPWVILMNDLRPSYWHSLA